MSVEIERKFLITAIPPELSLYSSKCISQGYIAAEPVIRIRKSDEQYFLTVKGKGTLTREEFELEISKESFDNLFKKADWNIINKIRYYIPLCDGLTAELDIYNNELSGLVTVEVEFKNVCEALCFVPPSWFGKELTEDGRFSNISLAMHGNPLV